MPRRLIVASALVLTAALSLLLLACGDDEEEGPTPTPTTAAASPTALSGETVTPGATPFQGGREPVEQPPEVSDTTPRLVDVRAASHEGFDRAVFEFDTAGPGFRVEYVDEATGCGSGLPAEIEGGALLQVRMTPADAHDEAGAPTFGEQELTPDLPSIIEAEQTCDFEADVTWVIGLTEEADFTAISLMEPFRVVVDVAHPAGGPEPTSRPPEPQP